MKRYFLFALITTSIILLFSACVTPPPVELPETGSAAETEDAVVQVQEKPTAVEKPGVIYSARSLSDGPLLLGTGESLSGPVSEFLLLFSDYFPLSGIEPPFSSYKEGEGTKWQVESDILDETVYFERALLSSDKNGDSWWYFKVEGDGFEREFEFLLDSQWILMEMRYRKDGSIFSYFPSVDENSDLASTAVDPGELIASKERIETAVGSLAADHYGSESGDVWVSSGVPGGFVRTVLKKDGNVILVANILEEKKGYETVLDSY